jgi:hypothetical protein
MAISALVTKLAIVEEIEPSARNRVIYGSCISMRADTHGTFAYAWLLAVLNIVSKYMSDK